MLKEIVLRQKQEKERLLSLTYVPRTQDQLGQKWLDSSLIKVVLGPRRAGKSVYSLMLLKSRPFMYFNFDDDVLAALGGLDTAQLMNNLHAVYGNVKTILFDEIQNVPAWELLANRLHREGYNLVLTGSNARLLSKELATHLTGRHLPIEILPFDFHEFLRAKKYQLDHEFAALPVHHGELLRLLEKYLVMGGFPEVAVNTIDAREYLGVLFDSLLFKDVVKRHAVRFSVNIANLGSHLLNTFTDRYSLRKLQASLGLRSVTTTEKYVSYLEEAYLIYSLCQYSAKSIQRIKLPKKVYVVDTGFVTAKAVQHSPDSGKLMENLVFMELIKRGAKPNYDLFYYQTRNGREVDFVVKQGIKVVELIQVCYSVSSSMVEKREVKALIEASQELKTNQLTIITWDDARTVVIDEFTLRYVPLWTWLMGS